MSSSRSANQPYGGFWIRVLATLIDSVVLTLASVVVSAGGAMLAALIGPRLPEAQMLVVPLSGVVAALIPILYLLICWSRSGRTLGKIACRLRIIREDGRPMSLSTACVRLLGYLLRSLAFGVGYLMVGFTNRKRGLHDMVAGTAVIRD